MVVDLVSAVKAVQKQPGGQPLWISYVQEGGGGKRDPALKSHDFLKAFLTMAEEQGFSISDSQPAKGGGKASWGSGGKGSWGSGGGGAGAFPGQLPKLTGNLNWMFRQGLKPNMLQNFAAGGQQQQDLVSRVKDIQKQGGREAWISFIETKGGGKWDPALRSEEELQEFLTMYGDSPAMQWMGGALMGMMQQSLRQQMIRPGGRQQQSIFWPPQQQKQQQKQQQRERSTGGGPFVPQSEEHANLIARIKAIRRTDEGQQQWHAFVDHGILGKHDPAAYTEEDLQEFLAAADPESETMEVRGEYDELKALVAQIRKGQRYSEEFKEAWIQYTDENGEGRRDPARHDADFIRTFLEFAPVYETYEGDEEHARLVLQIKQGQRNSEAFKMAWWDYCTQHGDSKNDPAKHDANFLTTFLHMQGGGSGKGGKAPTKSKGKIGRARPY